MWRTHVRDILAHLEGTHNDNLNERIRRRTYISVYEIGPLGAQLKKFPKKHYSSNFFRDKFHWQTQIFRS